MLPSEEVKGTVLRAKLDGRLYVIWDVERGRFTVRDLAGNPGSEMVLHDIGCYFDTVPVPEGAEARFERVLAFDTVPEKPVDRFDLAMKDDDA